ncbi:acyl carrier protein [Anatilimnocola aggregata]|nr:hypothetical protein [Anatilimnocola aggregata]
MDFIELVYAVEEEFDVKISHRDWQELAAQKPVTAGSLADFVFEKLPETERLPQESSLTADSSPPELTQAAVDLINRAALRWLQEKLREFKQQPNHSSLDFPEELKLASLIRGRQVRSFFRTLKLAGLQTPHLWLSWRQMGIIAGFSAVLGLLIFAERCRVDFLSAALGGGFAFLLAYVGGLIAGKRWFAATPSTKTVGQLADHLAALNPRFFGRLAAVKLNRLQVWIFVQKCLADLLGEPVESIKPESRLVEDLGMD